MLQYIVQRGDTLFLIAQRFGVNLYRLIGANPQITNTSYLFVGQIIYIPLPALYIIKQGETLAAIALRIGIPLRLLLDANTQITNPDRILPGMQIVIPSPAPSPGLSLHMVMSGDTLYSIAQKFRTTVSALMKLNPEIASSSLIFIGQKILVPLLPPLKLQGCLVFASNRSGKTELWLGSPSGETQKQITGKSPVSLLLSDQPEPKWSPDGQYIAFLVKSAGNNSLYILKPCERQGTKIAKSADRFSWSNKGNKIAYSNDEGTFITTLDGRTQKVSDKLFSPVWFPDDKTLFGWTFDEALPYEIMGSVDVTGQNFKAYLDPIIPADSVRISPNGRYIAISAFIGRPDYVFAWISIYDISSKSLVTLPGTEFGSNGSVYNISLLGGWSPDSTKLVYSTLVNQNGYAEIKIASPQGAVLKSYGRGFYPDTRWSPETELIMFTLSENAGTSALVPTKPRNIYILNLFTDQQVKVTNTGDNFNPDWTQRICPECN